MLKITRILIVALLLSSCGLGSRTKQETSSDNTEDKQELTQDEITSHANITVPEAISPDSLTFNTIRQFLLDADYYIAPANGTSYAKTSSAKTEKIESCIGDNEALAADLSDYRRICFDTYNTQKPMLLIEQYVFTDERSADIFMKKFELKTKDQFQDRLGVFGFVSKATQAGSTIYVFMSALSEVDSVMWAIAEYLNPIILESVVE